MSTLPCRRARSPSPGACRTSPFATPATSTPPNKRVGHLFEGRFKAFLVDQDSDGLELVRYIHLNPVRSGMVTEAAACPWSGHRSYLGQKVHAWITTDWVLRQFGATVGVARRRYAQFVADGAQA